MTLDARSLQRHAGTALLVFATPVVANVIIWRLLVAPQQVRTRAWQDAKAVSDAAPALQRLLTESELAVADWQRDAFSAAEPARVTETLRLLAARHHVTLDEVQPLRTGDPSDGLVSLPVSVQVTGGFGRVARWLSAVEAHPALRIDTVVVTPDVAGRSVATLKLTALLRQT